MKSCQQDISKSIWARGLKLGQVVGDDEVIWLKFKKFTIFFRSYGPFKIWMFWKNRNELFSASYLEKYLKLSQLIGDDE